MPPYKNNQKTEFCAETIFQKACLAVDAIFFKPEFKITVENAIFGLQDDKKK